MKSTLIQQIEERLQELSPEKLVMVLQFVTSLSERPVESDAFQTMLASEAVLRRDWDIPEEKAAWVHLR